MSYLGEFERIKGRSSSQSIEKVQAEALLHIAKCLSYIVDSDIKDQEEAKERRIKLEQKLDYKPLENFGYENIPKLKDYANIGNIISIINYWIKAAVENEKYETTIEFNEDSILREYINNVMKILENNNYNAIFEKCDDFDIYPYYKLRISWKEKKDDNC